MGCCFVSRGKRKVSSADSIVVNDKDIQISGLSPVSNGTNTSSTASNNNNGSYKNVENYQKRRRKCRNSFCLFLFGMFLAFLIILNMYVMYKSDFRRIANGGVDSNCDICGVKNDQIRGIPSSGQDMRERPYLIYIYEEPQSRILNSLIYPDNLYYKECIEQCPPNYKVIFKQCFPIPRNLTKAADFYNRLGMQDFYDEIKQDLEKNLDLIFWMCLIALGTSLSIAILLRFLVKIIIWLVVLGILVSGIGGSITLWLYYKMKKLDQSKLTMSELTDWDQSKLDYTLGLAIFASIGTVIILFVIIGMRKHISLVVGLFTEAGKTISSMPFLLIQPLWTFGILTGLYVSFGYMALHIESAGDLQVYFGGARLPRCRIVKDDLIQIARWSNIFGLLWFTQLVIDCQHFIVAGSVSSWFFTRDKKSARKSPILWSIHILINYHLGSIVFGSLIITAVKCIRLILNFIQKRLVNNSQRGNEVCKVLLNCFKCFTWLLEKVLVFLNRNAYIEMAIYGHGFCTSAKLAFKVLVSNALRVAAINSIGDFVLFLAKLVIVLVTCLIGHELLKERYSNIDDESHIWAPIALAALFSYFIAHCFITIYEMTIDTIFICFCEDCDMNDGVNSPYYMSKGLMEFVRMNKKMLAQN